MNRRSKRKLGEYFDITNFGINLTELLPGAMSSLKHHHLIQDEFIYILSGTATLICGDTEFKLTQGECFGFKSGNETPHQLINKSTSLVTYLEVGDRNSGDQVIYLEDDLCAQSNKDGTWTFTHKNGKSY